MALSLVAIAGAANANTYADDATATAHAAYRVNGAAFIALTADQRAQALATATGDIGTLENFPGFLGSRDSGSQALAFPRDGGGIPVTLVHATIELAMSYAPAIASATTDVLNAEYGNGNVQEDTVGPITTKYFQTQSKEATAFDRLPPVVQRLLYPLVRIYLRTDWGSTTVTRGS